ncbi:ATP-binding cassette domain-containing protein [Paenibacillus sp. LMG 31461]|uniref:ATP-binding cassette domain-containing protein n=1 Tax=Paenibacillus plantarum TaxID=2654975 RepID=A0ABX1X5A3_9BACL|nr:ATP-binding cassette domain-containing protein [Paenibacillus plantarum]NOU63566.1 ATP-binding cassette domain-containing protein [Paenibacillus plantarum]
MQIEVRQLSKQFGGFLAADDVSFSVQQGQLIGFLGPSGGGKTTILRMLAGLEEPTSGHILFDGQLVNDLAPQARNLGFVFQNYALFRHMSVFDNIAFGLNVQKKKKVDIQARVHELITLTGLTGLEKRLPHQLSGGQRQRVAFARALAPNPGLLLLDEPFAAIDAKVRKELRTWLRETINKVGITTIFVTHDQEEAVEVADEIMIISQGRLEQKGTPIDIYKNPQTPFVAGFIGESSEISDAHQLWGFEQLTSGSKAVIRPEFVEVGDKSELSHPSASQEGIVRNLFFRGTSWQVEVEVGAFKLIAYRSLEKPALHPGASVHLLIHRVYVFDGIKTSIIENGLKQDPIPVHI